MISKEGFARFVLFVLGVFLFIKAISMFIGIKGYLDAYISMILAAFWSGMGGVCFAYAFLPGICQKIGNEIFMPMVFRKSKARELSRVKGLIAQDKFQEAEEELVEILKKEPYNIEAVSLLTHIYMDNTGQFDSARDILFNYFNSRSGITRNDSMLVHIYTDACLELNDIPVAVSMLKKQIATKGYSTTDIKNMQKRLESLS